MTVLRNNFSSGPDGTDITNTNSGLGEDNIFDSYNNPASSDTILKYKSADGLDRPTADYVMKAESGVSSGSMGVIWYTSMGAQSQFWIRMYFYFTVSPNNFISPGIMTSLKLPSTIGASLGIISSGADAGKLFTENTPGTLFVASANPIVAGAWFRVEARFQQSTTTGNGEIRYFEEPDSDEPTDVFSFSGWNLGASTVDYWLFGYYPADSTLETLYLSGLALSNEDWIGPEPFRPGRGVPGYQPTPIAVHSDTW